jgi:hypothetical protein
MISTIERDFKMVDGKATFPMKEYPDWYGIEGIGFIWHGSWSDPEIEYKGHRMSCYIVEDTMWERFREDCEELGKNADACIDEFDMYMKDNAEDVYELIELAMESM